jgi:hypothetical protein
LEVPVFPSPGIVDSSRGSTFDRLSFGEIKLNNPGEPRLPNNLNNFSRSSQRILHQRKFYNGAFLAFFPHNQAKRLPQSMQLTIS